MQIDDLTETSEPAQETAANLLEPNKDKVSASQGRTGRSGYRAFARGPSQNQYKYIYF